MVQQYIYVTARLPSNGTKRIYHCTAVPVK